MADSDLYMFLESDRSACDDVLTKNYRRLARSFHPDKNPGAGEKFKEISNAYRILSDPIRRRMYDCHGVEYLKQPHMFQEEEELQGMQPANDDIEVLELSSDSSANESESENQARNGKRKEAERKNQAGRKPLSVKMEKENRITPKEVERLAPSERNNANFETDILSMTGTAPRIGLEAKLLEPIRIQAVFP
ncbi:DnaJ -like protein subfamily A member 2 [Halotydeus destructor]|nr:DnaJ -like protein subfamily A member 2 [Halotydeus destructor]